MSPSLSDVNYRPAYPVNHPLDSSIKNFIARFFAISDTPGPALTEHWVDFFRDDATLVMGNDEATGKEGIAIAFSHTMLPLPILKWERCLTSRGTEIWNLRLGMWKTVDARKHTVFKVFPGSFDSIVAMHEAEFMMFGKVAYRLKMAPAPGAERTWGFAFYRVYLQR
ncbi:hypothetical protein B0H67DRAFT_273624 [Lasiosphaeris hirsuta]|uniref:Uncharacterized protein n=1 Tax=Lasiosphaeris hirsuta TaxID=260670 RepID=A0AA40A850_9PEZI|nr:hypothetical protein B0H67DRAFT_273624 [Lasiosphaeris hirsuta]